MVEYGQVPLDAEISHYTWRYVNVDGGPDRRFKNNRKLPVVWYGTINITSGTGLNLCFHCSNENTVYEFGDAVNGVISIVTALSMNVPDIRETNSRSEQSRSELYGVNSSSDHYDELDNWDNVNDEDWEENIDDEESEVINEKKYLYDLAPFDEHDLFEKEPWEEKIAYLTALSAKIGAGKYRRI